jgi:hypothetical protein
MAARNPMQHGPAKTVPSSARRKIGAYFWGAVERVSLIALNL